MSKKDKIGHEGITSKDAQNMMRAKKFSQAREKNLLKIKRWEAGLKQDKLAFLQGCSAPYLSSVENNREEATHEFKRKCAAIFETSVDEIFPQG